MNEKIVKAPAARVRRVPIGHRNKISLAERDPNYHYRVVNVEDGKVETYTEHGYEVVLDAKVGDRRVDTAAPIGSTSQFSVGLGKKAVVMRIRKDWYDEDQKTKQEALDAQEADMNNKAKQGA